MLRVSLLLGLFGCVEAGVCPMRRDEDGHGPPFDGGIPWGEDRKVCCDGNCCKPQFMHGPTWQEAYGQNYLRSLDPALGKRTCTSERSMVPWDQRWKHYPVPDFKPDTMFALSDPDAQANWIVQVANFGDSKRGLKIALSIAALVGMTLAAFGAVLVAPGVAAVGIGLGVFGWAIALVAGIVDTIVTETDDLQTDLANTVAQLRKIIKEEAVFEDVFEELIDDLEELEDENDLLGAFFADLNNDVLLDTMKQKTRIQLDKWHRLYYKSFALARGTVTNERKEELRRKTAYYLFEPMANVIATTHALEMLNHMLGFMSIAESIDDAGSPRYKNVTVDGKIVQIDQAELLAAKRHDQACGDLADYYFGGDRLGLADPTSFESAWKRFFEYFNLAWEERIAAVEEISCDTYHQNQFVDDPDTYYQYFDASKQYIDNWRFGRKTEDGPVRTVKIGWKGRFKDVNKWNSEGGATCTETYEGLEIPKASGQGCKKAACSTIKDKATCLQSKDNRADFQDQYCAWCPDGPCAGSLNQCEPTGFLRAFEFLSTGLRSRPQEFNKKDFIESRCDTGAEKFDQFMDNHREQYIGKIKAVRQNMLDQYNKAKKLMEKDIQGKLDLCAQTPGLKEDGTCCEMPESNNWFEPATGKCTGVRTFDAKGLLVGHKYMPGKHGLTYNLDNPNLIQLLMVPGNCKATITLHDVDEAQTYIMTETFLAGVHKLDNPDTNAILRETQIEVFEDGFLSVWGYDQKWCRKQKKFLGNLDSMTECYENCSSGGYTGCAWKDGRGGMFGGQFEGKAGECYGCDGTAAPYAEVYSGWAGLDDGKFHFAVDVVDWGTDKRGCMPRTHVFARTKEHCYMECKALGSKARSCGFWTGNGESAPECWWCSGRAGSSPEWGVGYYSVDITHEAKASEGGPPPTADPTQRPTDQPTTFNNHPDGVPKGEYMIKSWKGNFLEDRHGTPNVRGNNTDPPTWIISMIGAGQGLGKFLLKSQHGGRYLVDDNVLKLFEPKSLEDAKAISTNPKLWWDLSTGDEHSNMASHGIGKWVFTGQSGKHLTDKDWPNGDIGLDIYAGKADSWQMWTLHSTTERPTPQPVPTEDPTTADPTKMPTEEPTDPPSEDTPTCDPSNRPDIQKEMDDYAQPMKQVGKNRRQDDPVTFVWSDVNSNCETACMKKGMICYSDAFFGSNAVQYLMEPFCGVTDELCNIAEPPKTLSLSSSTRAPFRKEKDGKCFMQRVKGRHDCTWFQPNARRFCGCNPHTHTPKAHLTQQPDDRTEAFPRGWNRVSGPECYSFCRDNDHGSKTGESRLECKAEMHNDVRGAYDLVDLLDLTSDQGGDDTCKTLDSRFPRIQAPKRRHADGYCWVMPLNSGDIPSKKGNASCFTKQTGKNYRLCYCGLKTEGDMDGRTA